MTCCMNCMMINTLHLGLITLNYSILLDVLKKKEFPLEQNSSQDGPLWHVWQMPFPRKNKYYWCCCDLMLFIARRQLLVFVIFDMLSIQQGLPIIVISEIQMLEPSGLLCCSFAGMMNYCVYDVYSRGVMVHLTPLIGLIMTLWHNSKVSEASSWKS